MTLFVSSVDPALTATSKYAIYEFIGETYRPSKTFLNKLYDEKQLAIDAIAKDGIKNRVYSIVELFFHTSPPTL